MKNNLTKNTTALPYSSEFINSVENSQGKYEQCLKQSIMFEGIGIHSGLKSNMVLHPAIAGYGIKFERIDIDASIAERTVIAKYDNVHDTNYCTSLANDNLTESRTVEHLLATLYILGISNCHITLDNPEVPIMDGSGNEFLKKIMKVGHTKQSTTRKILKLLRPVSVKHDKYADAFVELTPSDNFSVDVTIDYADDAIGLQQTEFEVTLDNFVNSISESRTYGFLKDHDSLMNRGYAKGANLDNTIVVNNGKVLNQDGLRHDKEFVMHKALDAIGDLSLMGYWPAFRYRGVKGGHELNNLLLQKLFSDSENYTIIEEPMEKINASKYLKHLEEVA